MPNVWFTADTHFRHVNLLAKGHRTGFDGIAEHDEALVTWWNETVRPWDTVWHLGDFGMGPAREFLPIVAQLHGTVHLVTGNHDAPWPANRDAAKHQRWWMDAGFASVQPFARRRVAGRQVLLSHFPYSGDHTDQDRGAQWRLPDLGAPLLHGHVHDMWAVRGHQLNVGVDVNAFRPVSMGAVAAWVEQLPDPADLASSRRDPAALRARFQAAGYTVIGGRSDLYVRVERTLPAPARSVLVPLKQDAPDFDELYDAAEHELRLATS